MIVNIKIVPNDVTTVCKAIIFDKYGKVLFLKRNEYKNIRGQDLDLPGGHLREGEDPKSGLIREVLEETKIKINSLSPFKKEKHQYFFTVQPNQYEISKIVLSHEHANYFFLDPLKVKTKNEYTTIASEAVNSREG